MQSLLVVLAAQLRQLEPQWAASLLTQAAQVPPLHQYPEPQALVQVPPHPSLPPWHLPPQLGVQQLVW